MIKHADMLKLHAFLRFLLRLLPARPGGHEPCQDEEWERDPLSHPVLQQMSLEQLADLPFERGPAREPAASTAWDPDGRSYSITKA